MIKKSLLACSLALSFMFTSFVNQAFAIDLDEATRTVTVDGSGTRVF